MPLRRLTNEQYANTVSDLLGVQVDVRGDLVVDRALGVFANGDLQAPPSTGVSQGYGQAAARLAEAAFHPDARAARIDEDACGDRCLEEFVERQGRLLFRRPLDEEETTVVLDAARAAGHAGGLWAEAQAALEILLQAPQFLYVFDEGAPVDEPDGVWKRSPHAIASRLSLLIWNRGPDADLLDRADAGALDTPEAFAEEVERLIVDPRFAQTAQSFFRQWLGYDLAETASKADHHAFDPDLAESLIHETDALVEYFVAEERPIQEIFGVDFTLGDERVRAFYGAEADPDDDARAWLPERRRGLLGHASFLAAISGADLPSPTIRGLRVLRQFMCREVGSPPADAPDELPEDDDLGPQTVRERTEAFMLGDTFCAVCHRQMDTIGFLFEDFDVIGKRRLTEPVEGAPDGHKPVSSRSAIPLWDLEDVDGLPGLAQVFSAREEVAVCLRENLRTWALGRGPEEADTRMELDMASVMADGDGTLAAAVRGLALSGALIYTRAPE